MRKIIIVTEVPEDCYKVIANIECQSEEARHFHILEYDENDIASLYRAYWILQEQLLNLGIS